MRNELRNFRTYDSHARILLSGVTSGVEVSPTRHFLISFPSLFAGGEPIAMYDLDAATRVFASGPSRNAFMATAFHWDERQATVDVQTSDMLGNSRRLRIRPDASGRFVSSVVTQ